MKKLIYAVMVATAVLAACTSRQSETASESEWALVWEEQFDGDSLDSTVWTRIDRGGSDWNNYMTKADTCYAMTDGKLVLRGIAAYEGDNDTVPYLTGGIFSKGKKAFSNGRLEICAKLQAGKGAWPAIWLMPDPAFIDGDEESIAWPKGGEIDIMERLNYDSIAYQTVHSYYTKNLNQDMNPPHYSTGRINPDDYNVFAVEMYPDSLCFFINDTHTFTYPRIETELEGQFPFIHPYYLLIDMQLGGNWVGEVDPSEVPVEMLVDWVRFYQKEK